MSVSRVLELPWLLVGAGDSNSVPHTLASSHLSRLSYSSSIHYFILFYYSLNLMGRYHRSSIHLFPGSSSTDTYFAYWKFTLSLCLLSCLIVWSFLPRYFCCCGLECSAPCWWWVVPEAPNHFHRPAVRTASLVLILSQAASPMCALSP